jgi:hypothetical protein
MRTRAVKQMPNKAADCIFIYHFHTLSERVRGQNSLVQDVEKRRDEELQQKALLSKCFKL